MKIVQIVAGAGGMYCGACARDAHLARTLAQRGHEVTVWPIYTPIRRDEPLGVPEAPLAFGGINAYLREIAPWTERLPKPVRAWLDSPGVLNFASRFAVRTQAADLGEMTVSVLRGTEGKHEAALRELAAAVAEEEPELVVLPNTLLSCLVPALRDEGVERIVCQVQGEDGFLDELPARWRDEAIGLVRQNVASIERLIAPCRDHLSAMRFCLNLPEDRFAIVPPAIVLPEKRPEEARLPVPKGATPHVGCLSSLRKAKGQDVLVQARNLLTFEANLSLAGRTLEPKFERQLRDMARIGKPVRFLGELPTARKEAFYAECDVLCVPSRLRESRGYAALEALVRGRPVVAPRLGIFPELAGHTAAVRLYRPDDPQDLARALSEALTMPVDDCARRIATAYSPQRTARAFWTAIDRRAVEESVGAPD